MKTIEKHAITLTLLACALVCVLTNHSDAATGFMLLLLFRGAARTLLGE